MNNHGIKAYFSQKAAEIFGSSFYRTIDGKEVEVTGICGDLPYNWDDKILVGYATDYVRQGQIGSWEEFEQEYDCYIARLNDYEDEFLSEREEFEDYWDKTVLDDMDEYYDSLP